MALVSSSAATPLTPPEDPNKPKVLFEWHEAAAGAAKGPVSVKIVIDQQKSTIYRGGQEIAWTMVALSTTNHPTPTGRFTVKERKVDKNSNLYGKIDDKDGKVVNNDGKMGADEIPERRLLRWFPDDLLDAHHQRRLRHAHWLRPGQPASHGCGGCHAPLPNAFMIQSVLAHP